MKKIILAIGAHPDDIEIGCGGTLSILRDQGYELVYLIMTSGEEGSISIPRRELSEIREREAEMAAQIAGASRVLFFQEPDGVTTFSKECKVRLISLLREIRPHTIFTHAQSDHFPDHQVIHRLTMAAISAACGPWYSGAGSSPHHIINLYGYEVWNPISNYHLAVDISAMIERKIEALSAHVSQIEEVDYIAAVKGLARYRGVTSMAGTYAEVFEVLKLGGI